MPLSCRARADAESTNQDSSDDVPLLVTEEMQLEKKVAQLRSTERRIDAQELKDQRVDDKLDAVKVELRDKTITADERASLLNEKSLLSRRSRMILNVLDKLYNDVAKLEQEIEELQKVRFPILSLRLSLVFYACLHVRLSIHYFLGHRTDVHSRCFALQCSCLTRLAFSTSAPPDVALHIYLPAPCRTLLRCVLLLWQRR